MRRVIPIAAPPEATAPSGQGVVHVVQHTSGEFLGLVEDHLEGRGVRFRYCRPFAGKNPLPREDDLGEGLILLGGGPWGSAGDRDVPTLAAEVALARAALERDVPVAGFGLGAQILAIAAGGGSEPAPLRFSVGEAVRVRDDALNGYLPARYPLAIYMRDRAVPPASARVLAEGEDGRPALWQVGRAAFGFAGNPGLKVGMVEDLIMEFEEAPVDPGPALERLKRAQGALEDALVPIMTGLVQITGWIRLG